MGRHKKTENTKVCCQGGDSTQVVVVNLLVLPFAIAGAVVAISFGLNKLIPRVYEVVPQYSSKVWDTETQTQLFVNVAFAYSLYLLVLAFLVMNGRLLAQKNPILQSDGLFIGTVNRILSNSVEQAAVFLPIYGYFVFYVSKPSDKELAIFIGLQFLFARIVYGLGYFFGNFIKLTVLRSFGMALTLGATLETLARVYVGPEFVSILNSFVPI